MRTSESNDLASTNASVRWFVFPYYLAFLPHPSALAPAPPLLTAFSVVGGPFFTPQKNQKNQPQIKKRRDWQGVDGLGSDRNVVKKVTDRKKQCGADRFWGSAPSHWGGVLGFGVGSIRPGLVLLYYRPLSHFRGLVSFVTAAVLVVEVVSSVSESLLATFVSVVDSSVTVCRSQPWSVATKR